MKIVCDNCATKYSIADEKVRGKVFKIRCKKCSHIIVVRGNDGAGAPAQADHDAGGDGFPGDEPATTVAAGGTVGASAGSDAVWHLVIDREQVGPLTVAEVRAKFAAGEIDVETYAWREGFGDWLRLGSIDDFRDLGAGAPAPHHEPEGATRRTDSADLFGQPGHDDPAADAGSDLFGGGAAAAAPQPMAAAPSQDAFAASAGAGGLFGAPESAPAPASRAARTSSPGFATGGGMSAGGAAAEVASDGGMKGQRNENSVLFSLNNLQALASGSGPSPAAAAPKAGVDSRPGFANSQTEGSGLIDIRAMAASTLSAGPSGPSAKQNDEPAFAAPVFSPMAAPILMPAAPSGPPKWLWPVIGLGVVSLLGIIVIGVLLLTRKPAEPVVAANTPPPATAQPAAQPTTQPVAQPATAPAPTQPAEAKATAPESAKEEHGKAHEKKGHEKGAAAAAHHEAAAAHESAPPPVAAPPPSESKKPAKHDSLDDLLNGASPDDKPAKHAAKADSGGDDNLPETLDKGAIVGGMGKVKGRVAACYDQFKVPGLANVSIVIGKSGSVKSANVGGAFSGTPTGSCVEHAVKTASFPKFKGSDVSITYPFMLR